MIGRRRAAHQASYEEMCQRLRGFLREAVEAASGSGGGVGSLACRVVATLYGLLLDHPLDRWGRCRSCRRPGEVLRLRRRRCRVHIKAHFYLHQPDGAFLVGHLAREVGLPVPDVPDGNTGLAPGGADPLGAAGHGTEVSTPTIGPEAGLPPALTQTPTASPPRPPAGRPGPDHGGSRARPERAGEPAALALTDLTAWIGLRRVDEGGVAVWEGSYYQHGRPVPEYLNTALADLVRAGYLAVAAIGPDPEGMRPVSLTQQGCDWYAVLCGQRALPPARSGVG